jgi:hypothetical protein
MKEEDVSSDSMASGAQPDPVCPVCSLAISQGNGLTFLRRDNVIHGGCLAAAQRRTHALSTTDGRGDIRADAEKRSSSPEQGAVD